MDRFSFSRGVRDMRETRYKLLPYDSGRYQWDGKGDYFQWWYFDAEFASGHRIMTFMMPRMGQVEGTPEGSLSPGIVLAIMDPEHNNHHSQAYYPGRFEGDPGRMRATFGDNLVEWVDGRYRLQVRQDGLGFDLEYEPLLPPWPPFPGRGGFMASPFTWSQGLGTYFHYASFVPRGRVTGKLLLPDGEVEVAGEGYHEQGRTNALVEGAFDYWYWDRFFLGDWTFIFPVAQSPARTMHATMRALLIYHKGECVADLFDVTGLFLRHKVLEYQSYEPAGRDDVPRRCLFTARQPGLRLRVEMDLHHQFEAICWQSLADTIVRQPAWLQHVMKVGVDLRWKGREVHLEGEGIFETMLTGNPGRVSSRGS
jgi:hypothetical protein